MSDANPRVATFVSQKISKIRWRPTPKQVIQTGNVFATGCWDNEVDNQVGIWKLGSGLGSVAEEDHLGFCPEGEPILLCEARHPGDVTDLVYLDQDNIVASSSQGKVVLYRHHHHSQTLSSHHTWERLHHFKHQSAPCTGIASNRDDSLVSVGEDGRLNVLHMEQSQPLRTIDSADSCTINGVAFLKQTEVATVNAIGQMKVWDTRQQTDQPARIFLLTGERTPLHCVDRHPGQPHIVATGGQDGTLCIWDMRQDKFPVTLLSAHQADMWEVRFHPTHPDHLFTCSEDGATWHWDGSAMAATPVTMATPSHTQKDPMISLSQTLSQPVKSAPTTSPWLCSEAAKHRLDITDLLTGNRLPVNSLDITDTTLICGTDGEQIYTIPNIPIR